MVSETLELHQFHVFSVKLSYRTSRVNNVGAELKNILYANDDMQLMTPYEAVSFRTNFSQPKLVCFLTERFFV